MGKVSYSGGNHGVSNSQLTLNNYNVASLNSAVAKHNQELDDMADKLISEGITNFTKSKLLFVEKDQEGKTIFLETGNIKSGLEHIKKHTKDFVKKHGIQENELIEHIKNIIKEGEIISVKERKLQNGKMGYDKLYRYKNKLYSLAGISDNGYLVSIMPRGGDKYEKN